MENANLSKPTAIDKLVQVILILIMIPSQIIIAWLLPLKYVCGGEGSCTSSWFFITIIILLLLFIFSDIVYLVKAFRDLNFSKTAFSIFMKLIFILAPILYLIWMLIGTR